MVKVTGYSYLPLFLKHTSCWENYTFPRLSSSKFILERPFAGVACSANAAVEYFVSVFNVAGVGLGTKGADSIMNMATMKLLCLVVLMGCCGQGQANINY